MGQIDAGRQLGTVLQPILYLDSCREVRLGSRFCYIIKVAWGDIVIIPSVVTRYPGLTLSLSLWE